jgi:hypothetical protein
MTDSEKWAWWTLVGVGLTVIAIFTFLALRGGPPRMTFSLIVLSALTANRRRRPEGRQFDEREKEIAAKALMAGFRALWVAFIGGALTIGFVKGWDATLSLPVWKLTATVWLAAMLLLTVESVTTLVLYRRG